MIENWLTKIKTWMRKKVAPPSVPEGQRIYAIGDIHGRIDLLTRLHEIIKEDAATLASEVTPVLIYLGDYVDRGPNARDVIHLLASQPLEGFDIVHLKGNHEAMMLEFIGDSTFGLSWRDAGGHATLKSYGAFDGILDQAPMAYDAAHTSLLTNIPQAHRHFLENLTLSAEFGDYFFTHAGVQPGTPLDQQKETALLWIRNPFLDSSKNFGKIVVHGHTPDKNFIIKPNRIAIDTGAWVTNVLTCLVLEGEERRVLQTKE